jgi:hypothetical protein
MEAFSGLFDFAAGAPAIIGLFLVALIIFLTSDWRVSLAALLVQYVLIWLTLTRFLEPEVALVKLLTGVLVVPILYLGTRPVPGDSEPEEGDGGRPELLGLRLGWDAGPLGFPLRLLAVLLVVLALTRLLGALRLPLVPPEVTFAAMWLGSMGLLGLVLGGSPLRIAPALLTVLAGFDLVYAIVEGSLAIIGLMGILTLLTALSFSFLTIVQNPGTGSKGADREGTKT